MRNRIIKRRRNCLSKRLRSWFRIAGGDARRVALMAACCVLAPAPAWACATCGCTLNADAALGYGAGPGWRMNFEYDYLHQDQLRSGTRAIGTVPDRVELEHDTLNRYLTVGLDYSPDEVWNIGLRIPYVIRTHSTYGQYDSTQPLPVLSDSRSSSLGDLKIISSYQGLLADRNLGVQLGLKLPTGRYGQDVDFRSGPAAGSPIDASLQPGTGSTDLIVGAYYFRSVTQHLQFFGTLQLQSAVTSRQSQPGKDYRPGNSTSLSFGVHYDANPRVIPQLQLNLLHKSVDQGALADIYSTAGYVAYLSPGLNVAIRPELHLYGFVQLPVYSDVVGYQLFPRYTFSVGMSYAF